jgi:hypothetical protein
MALPIRLPEPPEPEEDPAEWRFRESPLPWLRGDEDNDAESRCRGEQGHRPGAGAVPPTLLRPLSEAEDALSRLDAAAQAAPEPLREGLTARIAFREAAGWLAHAQAWVHPHDLCLRDLGLTGSYLAAAAGGRLNREMPATTGASGGASLNDDPDSLPEDLSVSTALALARTLRRLTSYRSWKPMASATAMRTTMSAVGGAVGEVAFNAWRDSWRRRCAARGALLATIEAVPYWALVEEAQGASEWLPERHLRPTLVAAVALRTCGRLLAIPLPYWSAVTMGRTSAILTTASAGARTAVTALEQIAEGARTGLRELARLREAAARGADLVKGLDRRSQLPAAVEAALHVPALTPTALAGRLGVAQQTANDLLRQMARANVVREITGRRAFRAYAA